MNDEAQRTVVYEYSRSPLYELVSRKDPRKGGLFWAYQPWIGFADPNVNGNPLMVWRNLHKTFTNGFGAWWSNAYFEKDGTLTITDNFPPNGSGGFGGPTVNTSDLTIPYTVQDVDADCEALMGTLNPGYSNVGQAWVCPQLDVNCLRPPPCSLAPTQLGAPPGYGWNFRSTLGQTSPMNFGPADCGCFYTSPKQLLPAAYRYYALPFVYPNCSFYNQIDIRIFPNAIMAGFMEKMRLVVPNMPNPYSDAYYDQNGNLLYCSQKPKSPTPILFQFDYAPSVIGWRVATDFGTCL